MNKEKFLISGASGFIGSAIFNELNKRNISCIGIGRRNIQSNNYYKCDLLDTVKLFSLLKGVTCVIHCAGYAHAFKAPSIKINEETWLINYLAAKNFFELATEAGVSKFINLSSVKVMSDPDLSCAGEEWDLNPKTEYGKSKLKFEQLIFNYWKNSKIKIVNLRLVMVYGRGSHGNLERMANLIRKRLFPPLPETNNKRSIIHIDDVVSAVMCVSNDSRADGQTFILTGPEAPSGREIFNEIRAIHGYKKIDFEVPKAVLLMIACISEYIQKIIGFRMPFNREVLCRLLESAWYSSKKIELFLDWKPNVDLKNGLSKTFCNEFKVH